MSELIERLRERAKVARSEGTGTSLGDALHFEEAAAEIEHLTALNVDAHAIVNRIWAIFRAPSYEILAGRTIYDLVQSACADAVRYQHLRDHCSSHYPMTHEQPAEWSIGWEFQQSKPHEAYGSFDTWIDVDIAAQAEREAAINDEETETGVRENLLGPCPECGAPAGMDCRTVQGRVPPHEARCGSGSRSAYDF